MEPVSVIIPTYNRAKFLRRAIESVLNQTHKEIELLIVDDGSTDDTKFIVSEFKDPRISYIFKRNAGVSTARNLGISLAKHNWIAFLDSDDEWLPQKLQEQVKYLHHKVIHTNEIWIRGGVRVNQMKKHEKFGGRIYEKCLPLCAMSPSTIMIHKDVFSDVGLFKDEFKVCEDYDLWLRICAKYEVAYIDEPLIKKYGGHDDQLSRKFHSMDEWRVRSLKEQLSNPLLTKQEQTLTKEMLIKKVNVLKNGYLKRGNQEKIEWVARFTDKI